MSIIVLIITFSSCCDQLDRDMLVYTIFPGPPSLKVILECRQQKSIFYSGDATVEPLNTTTAQSSI